jgi:hypothetical protein
MRELALGGLIAIAFGMASYYASDQFGVFSYANVILGGLAIAVAAARGLSRLRGASSPAFRGVLIRGVLGILAAALLGIAMERAAYHSGIQFDWSFERKFALSQATVTALANLPCELTASLYYDDFDPRSRSTRLLLRTMERTGGLRFDERRLVTNSRPSRDPPRAPSTKPSTASALSTIERSTSHEEPARGTSNAPMRSDSPDLRRRCSPRAIASAIW